MTKKSNFARIIKLCLPFILLNGLLLGGFAALKDIAYYSVGFKLEADRTSIEINYSESLTRTTRLPLIQSYRLRTLDANNFKTERSILYLFDQNQVLYTYQHESLQHLNRYKEFMKQNASIILNDLVYSLIINQELRAISNQKSNAETSYQRLSVLEELDEESILRLNELQTSIIQLDEALNLLTVKAEAALPRNVWVEGQIKNDLYAPIEYTIVDEKVVRRPLISLASFMMLLSILNFILARVLRSLKAFKEV
jgi:hypothetical protein